MTRMSVRIGEYVSTMAPRLESVHVGVDVDGCVMVDGLTRDLGRASWLQTPKRVYSEFLSTEDTFISRWRLLFLSFPQRYLRICIAARSLLALNGLGKSTCWTTENENETEVA